MNGNNDLLNEFNKLNFNNNNNNNSNNSSPFNTTNSPFKAGYKPQTQSSFDSNKFNIFSNNKSTNDKNNSNQFQSFTQNIPSTNQNLFGIDHSSNSFQSNEISSIMPSSGNFGSTLQNSENIAKNDNTKNYISAPTDFPSLSQTQTFPFNINAKSFDSGNDKTKSPNAKSAFEQNDFGTIPSNSPWSQNVGNSAFGNEGDNKSVLSAFSFGNFRNGDNIFGNFDGNNDKKNEDNNADIFKNFIGSNVNTGEDNSGDKNDDREEGQLIEDKVKDFLIGEIKDDVIGGNNSSSSEEKIEDFEEIDGVKYKKWEIEQFAAENDFDCVPITFPVENVVWKNFV